ncbi:hypothetical protein VTL71DRAFT_10394 [Oculimacula yallundae]|uniref:SnoaL-like domain-containing protein n=1 Tax=Oculimacula yallundae TaxID=86028 RepID=A0ABR4CSY7_9HELO
MQLTRIDNLRAKLSPLTEIDVYDLLKFNHINFIDSDPDLDGNHLSLAPHTYPNAAAFKYLTETVDELSASFWYGGVLPSPITAGWLAGTCNNTTTGLSPSGKLVAEQTFLFVKNGTVIQDQKFGRFRGTWDGVGTVAFGVEPARVAAFVDNCIAILSQEGYRSYHKGNYSNGTWLLEDRLFRYH